MTPGEIRRELCLCSSYISYAAWKKSWVCWMVTTHLPFKFSATSTLVISAIVAGKARACVKHKEIYYISVTQNHIFLVEPHRKKKKSVAGLWRSIQSYKFIKVHIPASKHIFCFRAQLVWSWEGVIWFSILMRPALLKVHLWIMSAGRSASGWFRRHICVKIHLSWFSMKCFDMLWYFTRLK